MPHRIGMAIICLHISAVLYFLIGLCFFVFVLNNDEIPYGLPIGIGMFAFCLSLIVGIEVVVYGLHKRKFWAWVAGLCIFAVYLPSLFFILGGLGLWGLLDDGSRAAFGVTDHSRRAQ